MCAGRGGGSGTGLRPAAGAAAFATLYECVTTLTLLMAPFVPFVTDYLWGVLRPAGAPESVHLASWPAADLSLIDVELSAQMALARRLVELGRSARSGASVRTRQPLRRALIGAAGFESLPAELRSLVAAELNVDELSALDASWPGSLSTTRSSRTSVTSAGGSGPRTPAVAAAITAVPAADIATAVLAGGTVPVTVEGLPDGARAGRRGRRDRDPDAPGGLGGGHRRGRNRGDRHHRHPGTAARRARARGHQARPGGRKTDGLDVTDRIALRWSASDPDLAAALTEHASLIAGEVLATEYGPEVATGDAPEHADTELGLRFWLKRA